MYRLLIMLALVPACAGAEVLMSDDFEHGLARWHVLEGADVRIVAEPGTDPPNHVLQLSPVEGSFSHATVAGSAAWDAVRFEGRVQFPEAGDGYLGWLYRYHRDARRADFGAIYLKSNGSYVRVSPHFDDNPSWRLYEELKHPMTGADRIEHGHWYRFRLDVRGYHAVLYVENMNRPVASFDGFDPAAGSLGLEARPGRGVPAWVDDVSIVRLPARIELPPPHRASPGPGTLFAWKAEDRPFSSEPGGHPGDTVWVPEWRPVPVDRRGLVTAGRIAQVHSGPNNLLRLQTEVHTDQAGPAVLAFSSANPLEVWLNGEPVGTVPASDYAWFDHVSNPDHAGTRLPVVLRAGDNTVRVRFDADRFAGGGFFAALLDP